MVDATDLKSVIRNGCASSSLATPIFDRDRHSKLMADTNKEGYSIEYPSLLIIQSAMASWSLLSRPGRTSPDFDE